MKFSYAPLVVVAFLASACIDSEYDLQQANLRKIEIGGNESVFEFPLTTLTLAPSAMQGGKGDMNAILSEMDIWLSSKFSQEEYIDLTRLASDPSYVDEVTADLIEEMKDATSTKLTEVVNLLWEREEYSSRFADQVPTDSEEAFKTSFTALFRGESPAAGTRAIDDLDEAVGLLHQTTQELAKEFLPAIQFTPYTFTEKLKINASIRQTLYKNLDDSTIENPVRAIYLIGKVKSEFPLSFRITPVFPDANVVTTEFTVEPDTEIDIPRTRFTVEAIDQILNNFKVQIQFAPERYYPDKAKALGDEKLELTLKIMKTGPISL